MSFRFTAQPMTSAPTVPSNSASATAVPARRKSRRLWWILIPSLVLFLLVVAAVVKGCQGVKPTTVTVEKAAVRNITHLVTATGKVQPEVEVSISPEVAGELIALPFKEGQAVKKGDVIVRIKPDFYVALAAQQEAALASARAASTLSKANLDKAEQDFRRADDLYRKKLISDSDYTVAKTGLDVARANFEASLAAIRQTEAALSQYRDQLSKTTIYAPIDGIVTVLNNEVGERVDRRAFTNRELTGLRACGNVEELGNLDGQRATPSSYVRRGRLYARSQHTNRVRRHRMSPPEGHPRPARAQPRVAAIRDP